MFSQMYSNFDEIFLKHQYGFRKRHNTQQYVLLLLEKWKTEVDKGKVTWALLTDL